MDDTGPGSLQDLTTALQTGTNNTNESLRLLTAAITGRGTGSFIFGAAATVVVSNVAVQANSRVILIPTNASAATLMGSAKSPYVSNITVGTNFTVSTANGVAATGTEAFQYIFFSPV